MDYLPQNPAILVSSINMLLRDEEFDSLEALCYNFNTEPEKIYISAGQRGMQLRITPPDLIEYVPLEVSDLI